MREEIERFLSDMDVQVGALEISKIELYVKEMMAWNDKVNLTAHRTLHEVLEKDLMDILYIIMYRILYIPENCLILDLGCGAGFVGVFLEIMKSDLKSDFIDSNRKKISFIKEIIRKLGLKGRASWQRAEAIDDRMAGKYDIVLSRATWQLVDFIKYAHNYVQNYGQIVWLAGPSSKNDLPLIKDYQGLELETQRNYETCNGKYQRKIFIFRKTGPFSISRGTG